MSIVEVQQQENKGTGANNVCVLPQLRGLRLVRGIQEVFFNDRLGQSQRPAGRGENDFLPQELMVALRQTALPSEYLGPPGVTNVNKLLRPMPPVNHFIFSRTYLSSFPGSGASSR